MGMAIQIYISFMSMQEQQIDRQAIADCFLALHSTTASPEQRRAANQALLDMQANPVGLLVRLLELFETVPQEGMRLQALVYFCNVVKRNWQLRRYHKAHADFQALKRDVREKLLQHLARRERPFLKTMFDLLRFLVDKDFPAHFPAFGQFALQTITQTDLSETGILMMKQLKETFFQLGQRKGSIGKKPFEELLRPVLNAACELSVRIKETVVSSAGNNTLVSGIAKLSKYSDQIILSLLRAAPADIMDEPFSKDVLEFLINKLQVLVSAHSGGCNKDTAALLEKNIKSLIFDLGLLQLSKPLLLSWVLPELFAVLLYVMQHPQAFAKGECLRYSLIGLRRIVKEFSYYAEDAAFMGSIKSKATSANCLQLRRKCAQFYRSTFSPPAVQQLLSFLLFHPYGKARWDGSLIDGQQGSGVQRGREKELGLGACVMMAVQGLLERFTLQTHHLITGLVHACLQSNWTNLDESSTGNLLSVLALLPSTAKKNDRAVLQEVPILQVLQFIYSHSQHRAKFANLVAGWLQAFTNQQLDPLAGVLLDFIGQAGETARDGDQGQEGQGGSQLLSSCCQCLNKIVSQRGTALDLRSLVQRVFPVALGIFQHVSAPSVLWPMVSLLSNLMMRVELDAKLLVASVDPSRLGLLVSNPSPTLVQALCEMFKCFLCVIPREMPATSIYQLICLFLNSHLSDLGSVNHEKIFHLWYIAVREYSPIHNCRHLYLELFQNHFRKNLYRKTATLVYTLEEYLLADLVPQSVQNFVGLNQQCYLQAAGLEKDERDKLQVAALSFQITLMTLFRLEEVNSDNFLRIILQELCTFQGDAPSATVRNSILSILNRYIALHLPAFLSFLESLPLALPDFLQAYFRSMDSLTSNTATKINAIAVTSLLNRLEPALILPHLHHILRVSIPDVQRHLSSLHLAPTGGAFIGRIDNSPSLRFASNTLSARKEETRRMDAFDKVDLAAAWRTELPKFMGKVGVSPQQVAEAFQDAGWAERFLRLL